MAENVNTDRVFKWTGQVGKEESFSNLDCKSIAIYLPPADGWPDRGPDFDVWARSKRGMPINQGTYWFPIVAPSFEDFRTAFAPLQPGEGYVVVVRGKAGLALSVSSRNGPKHDGELTFTRPAEQTPRRANSD